MGRNPDTIDDYFDSVSAGFGHLSQQLGYVTAEATRVVGRTVSELHNGEIGQLHERAANAAQKSIEIGQRTWSGIREMLSSTVNKLESFTSMHDNSGSAARLRSRVGGHAVDIDHASNQNIMLRRATYLDSLGETQTEDDDLATYTAVSEMRVKERAPLSSPSLNTIQTSDVTGIVQSDSDRPKSFLERAECTKPNINKSNMWSCEQEDGEDWGEAWGT